MQYFKGSVTIVGLEEHTFLAYCMGITRILDQQSFLHLTHLATLCEALGTYFAITEAYIIVVITIFLSGINKLTLNKDVSNGSL